MLKLELCDHVATISSLSFAPHPSVLLVSASMDGTLKLWDMSDDGNMIKTLRTNCTAFYGCCWSPDAMALATVGNYHSVNITSYHGFNQPTTGFPGLLESLGFFVKFPDTGKSTLEILVQGPGKSWNFLRYDIRGGHSDTGANLWLSLVMQNRKGIQLQGSFVP